METRVCKICGKELPIEDFFRNRYGVTHTCKSCLGQRQRDGRASKKENRAAAVAEEVNNARLLRLNDFTPRELMRELNRRGYEGTLTYTRVEKIDISTM